MGYFKSIYACIPMPKLDFNFLFKQFNACYRSILMLSQRVYRDTFAFTLIFTPSDCQKWFQPYRQRDSNLSFFLLFIFLNPV
jgi:hypothetical protein